MATITNFRRKLKRTLLIITGIIVLFVVLVILFISPLTKYFIEKYDEKYTGRQITLDWAYVNLFTGYIHLDNLKFFEQKERSAVTDTLFGKNTTPGDSVFLSIEGLSANFEMLKMLSKTYEISQITINAPKGIILQSKKDFNFSDLIEKFDPKGKVDSLKEATHFNILNIKINDGIFYYKERGTPINYSIKNVDFECEGKRWNVDTIVCKLSLSSGVGSGDLKSNFTINTKNKNYALAVILNKFDTNILEQYLKDITNYGSLSALIDADFKSKGNFVDYTNVTNSGLITINDLHFGKNPKEDYIAFKKFAISIKEVSPKKKIYAYDSLALTEPYIKYERYDHLDNFQNMFGKKGAKAKAVNADETKFNLVLEIGKYIKNIGKNFFRSKYQVNRLVVYNGRLKYNDFALREKFSVELDPLNILADSIDKKYKHVDLSLKSGIKPYGSVAINIDVNPKDSSDFDLRYRLNKISLAMFNPYAITYTSFPLDRGTIELHGNWKVRNGNINSMNHLVLIDPRLSNRQRKEDTKWLPMRLIMFFIRERGNVIDYEVPITGDLKNPKFNLWDVVKDVLTNIFVKPATTAYRMQVKTIESKIEKSLKLDWEIRATAIQAHQERFMSEIAEFLKTNPAAQIQITPYNFELKEKEYILFFETKKKYWLATHSMKEESLTDKDKEEIDKLSVKDSSFVRYMNKHINESLLFTVQEKCYKYLGSDIVNKKYKGINKDRETAFLNYFKDAGLEKQIKILNGKSTIPYNGFSYFKIEYKGDFPESLMTAYKKMNDLDNEPPRDKFKDERKKSRRFR